MYTVFLYTLDFIHSNGTAHYPRLTLAFDKCKQIHHFTGILIYHVNIKAPNFIAEMSDCSTLPPKLVQFSGDKQLHSQSGKLYFVNSNA